MSEIARFDSHCLNRLKAERKRLGLRQAEIADLCGITRETWGQYERGLTVPGGNALACFAANGADIQYILTGKRSYADALAPNEKKLIDHFRNAPPNVKAAAFAGLTAALIAGSAPTTSINVSGDGNRFAGRDYHVTKKSTDN